MQTGGRGWLAFVPGGADGGGRSGPPDLVAFSLGVLFQELVARARSQPRLLTDPRGLWAAKM